MARVGNLARKVGRRLGLIDPPRGDGGYGPMPPFPTEGLVGDHAIIRRYRADDLASRAALEVSDGVGWAQIPAMSERREAFLAETNAAVDNRWGPYALAVVRKDDGRYIGEGYIEHSGVSTAMYAFAFLPQYRGTDASREALRLVPTWLMTTSIHRLEATHSIENVPAHRALLRMGFPVEGVKRLGYPLPTPDGIEWYDECCHAIVNESDTAAAPV